jgi:hypothetical protein
VNRIARALCVVALLGASAAPAKAALPGANGKLAFSSDRDGGYDVYVAKPDGTGVTRIARAGDDSDPAWSPDGQRLATVCGFYLICVMNPDGSGSYFIEESGQGEIAEPTWSPDGAEVAFAMYRMNYCPDPSEPDFCAWQADLAAVDAGGSYHDRSLSTAVDADEFDPAWSPDGTKIAFAATCVLYWYGGCGNPAIETIAADGTGVTDLGLRGRHADWSADGTKLVYSKQFPGVGQEIMVANANGTGETRLTNDTADDTEPVWSPDGGRIAFQSKRDGADFEIHVMSADGSGRQAITDNGAADVSPDWQPLLSSGYPRPKGAATIVLSLVPAFAACTAPDRTHGAPLASGSCASPTQLSTELTVGTPDANGGQPKSLGLAEFATKVGDPATPADEADVHLRLKVTDVRAHADLTDYTGQLTARLVLRITDRDNSPYPGGPGPGTVVDTPFSYAVTCTATSDATIGSTCGVVTTADAVLADVVKEGRRTLWELDRFDVLDGNGDPFLTQGIFVP